MNVGTLILQLQQMAQPNDEVFLIVEEYTGTRMTDCLTGIFTGKVIGTGTGAEIGKCEIYGIS